MQKELIWGYNMFIRRVSEARGLSRDSVDAIGQGRVYSGGRGKEIGLVDSIGGMLDAIGKCANLAEVKKPLVTYIPCMKREGIFPFDNLNSTSMLRIPPSGLYYLSPIIGIK